MTPADIDAALTEAFRSVMGWCPAKDDPPVSWGNGSRNAKIAKRRAAVAERLQRGVPYKQIARELDITVHCVGHDVVALYRAGKLKRRP